MAPGSAASTKRGRHGPSTWKPRRSKPTASRGPLFGIHASNGGRVMIFAGGVPLTRDGQIIGAIGVSGGDDKQDQTVAEAGEAAL